MFKKIAVSLSTLAMVVAPAATFAAVNTTHLTLDGKTNITVSEGDVVEAVVTYDITSNDDVESLRWEIIGSGLPSTPVNIPDRINSGTFTATFPIDTTGASEGTWDVRVTLFGTNGSGANQNGTLPGVDTQTFTNRITITDDEDGVGSGNDEDNSPWATILASLQAILAKLSNPVPPPAPVDPLCTQFNMAKAGTAFGMSGAAGLQNFLISNGYSHIITYGATGYWGTQTQTAVMMFQSAHNCK